MGVFDAIGDRSHEEIVFGNDPVSGLKSIIAIHSTALGPALGGTRFFPYESEADALEDVLRLSQGMTRKAAAAGLDLGGGKAVIIGDPRTDKSERLWRAYGRVVDSLQGRYITAEDVGTDTLDMDTIRHETRWVVGVPVEEGGSGDPSPATARGIIAASRAVAEFRWGSDDLSDKTVAILGVGKVGTDLARRYKEIGARIIAADVHQPALDRAQELYGVEPVALDDIYDVECDIFAPCSLGGVLNESIIPRLNCQVVVGAANNQLATDMDAERLADRDILYAPDFVANAGGLINVSEEIGGYTVERAAANIDKVYFNMCHVLKAAKEKGLTPYAAAVEWAERRVEEIGNLRLFRRSGDHRD
ncbi:MAG: leucine dehydrogenase [Actinobacteria bacterium]|nr:leucine dehydrogenase [Actinomycetota bacterium]MBU1493362.1 leucine dehydrogenase [Actinomycetota bacterium]